MGMMQIRILRSYYVSWKKIFCSLDSPTSFNEPRLSLNYATLFSWFYHNSWKRVKFKRTLAYNAFSQLHIDQLFLSTCKYVERIHIVLPRSLISLYQRILIASMNWIFVNFFLLFFLNLNLYIFFYSFSYSGYKISPINNQWEKRRYDKAIIFLGL